MDKISKGLNFTCHAFGVSVDLCANRIYKHIARWGFQQSTCNLRICGNKHVTPSGFAGKKNSSRMGLLF
jgi:hypothetical protein